MNVHTEEMRSRPDVVTFDAGFFCVESPRKGKVTPELQTPVSQSRIYPKTPIPRKAISRQLSFKQPHSSCEELQSLVWTSDDTDDEQQMKGLPEKYLLEVSKSPASPLKQQSTLPLALQDTNVKGDWGRQSFTLQETRSKMQSPVQNQRKSYFITPPAIHTHRVHSNENLINFSPDTLITTEVNADPAICPLSTLVSSSSTHSCPRSLRRSTRHAAFGQTPTR
uniref:uncharacterized protein n=1 Tax=Myxine glutinosa TaxID=7769 RepID=UPI00358E7508